MKRLDIDLYSYNNPILQIYQKELESCKKIPYEEHNDLAKDELVESFLQLGFKLAYNHRDKSIDVQDMIQEASLVLLRCAQSWNPEKGRFITYAYNSIVHHLNSLSYKSGYNTIHTPRISKNTKNYEKLQQQALSISIQKLPIIRRGLTNAEEDKDDYTKKIPRAGDYSKHSKKSSLVDPNDYFTQLESKLDNKIIIEKVFRVLSKNDKRILKLYYGIGCKACSYKEISKRLKLHINHVRQRRSHIIYRLQKLYKTEEDL